MNISQINKGDVLFSDGYRFTVVKRNPTTVDVINPDGRKVRAYPEIFSHKAMSADDYKAALAALSLSQERGGDWLGIGRRTSQGYALNEYPVPEPIAKLLRLCVKMKLKAEDVK